jgi:hypothetical protein
MAIGIGAAAILGGLMGGGALGSGLLSAKGSKAAGKALKRQRKRELRFQREVFALQKQLLEEAAPQRQAALGASTEALGLLRGDVARQFGESPFYRRALETQTSDVLAQLSKFGLDPRSSAASRTVGELSAGLGTQEIESLRGARFQLAGLAPQQTSQALGLTSAAGASLGRSGTLQAQRGEAGVGYYDALGKMIGQFGQLGATGIGLFSGRKG